MNEKLVKSYIFLGNLPIYNKTLAPGANTPEGCEFVINTRIKYELGVASMQFIKQSNPSIYNVDLTSYPEIELDISSLIRFKKLIEFSTKPDINPTTSNGNDYIIISSTKLKKLVEYQKPAFVKTSKGIVTIIIENNKVQSQFEIFGDFQIECLMDLLDNIIIQLSSAYINYDIMKNQGGNSIERTLQPKPYVPPYIKLDQREPFVVPKPFGHDTWVPPIPVMCSNVPQPLTQMGVTNITAPMSITTSVIPQMPGIPDAPKF